MNTHDHEQLEAEYWGTCANTFEEDQKHYVYAEIMGIPRMHYSFDAGNRRILDIGGGPTSMLLKCRNLNSGVVVDPLAYPAWTQQRYQAHCIEVAQQSGESYLATGFDEVWIYNCLQHVEDPEQIIRNAVAAAPVLRLFEWTDIPPHPGHPHELTETNLRQWIGRSGGQSYNLAQQGCYGRAFGGVFA